MRNTMRRKNGFTIVEMLMAMSITALLLTALAASINASVINANVNEDSFKAINNARQALGRMCAELRTSQAVEIYEAFDYCSFVNADSEVVKYWHRNDNNTLYLIKDSNFYVLCDGVESLSFTKGLDPDNPGVVRNVQISITVKVGDISKKLSTATVIMRNMP